MDIFFNNLKELFWIDGIASRMIFENVKSILKNNYFIYTKM
jgi:hypothetical protein